MAKYGRRGLILKVEATLLSQTAGNFFDAVLLNNGERQEERLSPCLAELEARRQQSWASAIQTQIDDESKRPIRVGFWAWPPMLIFYFNFLEKRHR